MMIRMSDIDSAAVDRKQSRPTLPMFGLHYTTALIFACNSGTAAANVPFDIRAEHYLPSTGMPAASCLCYARGWLSNVTYRVGGNSRIADKTGVGQFSYRQVHKEHLSSR